MKLVVVESPAKAKTIERYLGKGYHVSASMGHIVDLPKKELGVDVDRKYAPKYVVTNRKALKKLRDDFDGADGLIIASDLDREGEAIGWHIAQRLGVIRKDGKLKKKDKTLSRIVFTSITKDAVQEAIENPREIDMNLVNAQQARRILDRLVGYTLSPLIWRKIRYGLSAGRVQSVAVRLIVDREEERNSFRPEEYWKVLADVLMQRKGKTQIVIQKSDEEKIELAGIPFELVKAGNQKPQLQNEKDARAILDTVLQEQWIITDKKVKESKRHPKPPFITSTLQRTASNMFGYAARKTMQAAQKLYERGFITYMRTDSFNIAPNELEKIRSYVAADFGSEYLSQKPIYYKSKSSSAQEAHEAIRPTDIRKTAKELGLTGDQQKLYQLIRKRAVACQMSPAVLENTTLYSKVGRYLFQSKGQRIVFDGFTKVYPEKLTENKLPKISVGQEVFPQRIIGEQHFTSPPPRYSEASLIKMLEKYGIGRPSTYAPIISTILQRKYVKKDGKYFFPTDTGIVVTRLLKKYFEKIVDTGFTAEMEEDLDKIAAGNEEMVHVIDTFYKPFIKDIDSGEKKISKEEFTVLGQSKYKCPECGKKMVKKLGRFGAFLSCSNFPKCKGMRDLDGKTEADKEKEMQKETQTDEFIKKFMPAPKAEDETTMILKSGRYGKFWAHPNYPKVKEAKPLLLKKKCPDCGEPLVERKGRGGRFFIGCSGYPKCRYIEKAKKKKK